MHHHPYLPLEIQLKPLDVIDTLLNYIDIDRYEIQYVESNEHEIKETEQSIKTFFTNNIYEYNCWLITRRMVFGG